MVRSVFALSTALLLAATLAWANPKTTKVEIPTNIPGLRCLEEKTTTAKDDWLKDNMVYRFITTNGKSCDVTVDLARSTFVNCKPVYKSAFINGKDSEWSMGFIDVQANDHGTWSCNLAYNVKWRN